MMRFSQLPLRWNVWLAMMFGPRCGLTAGYGMELAASADGWGVP